MKVLHINAGLEEGGAKTHIVSLLSQFPTKGVELLVFEEGFVAQEARLIGIKVHVVNQNSRYDLTIISKVINYIKTNHFDIVHSHGARANLVLALIKKKINSTWVATVHSDPRLDFMDKGLRGKFFSYLNIWSLKKADKLIVVTDDIKKELINSNISSEKIFIVYNGIIFDGKSVNKESNTLFTMTCVARLHPIKGHEFLLESISSSELSDFQLNLIGEGELKEKLRKRVRDLKLEEKVKFYGALQKSEIEKVLQKTDLTVLTSISEGFPLVLLESANQKIPFISTDVGNVARLVPNSSYGWLVPVNDYLAFSAALKEAYNLWQSNKLAEKGENLFQLASKEYSLNKVYLDTLNIYKDKDKFK
ncbi:MAG: glycosyltransferase [Carnobacterium sp.]|uniref:glycosyltransferase n=1 Tax=Carnobacterium sp. TaxID=48221 RepID=UPI003C75B803